MKKVFTNSQLAHVWAQQTQSEGRNSKGSMYFRGTDIYSYGSHYMIARIYTVKGKRFALVNSAGYSPTTGGHTRHVINALSGLMPYFMVLNIGNPKLASKELDVIAQESIGQELRRVKVSSKTNVDWAIKTIEEKFKKASQLRGIIGKVVINPSKKDIDAIKDHFKKRFARFKELNSPANIAKREAVKAEREAVKQAKEKLELEENINKFRHGLDYTGLYSLPFELLRVKNDKVQTSRGAEVPLRDATVLCRALEKGKSVLGQTVGNFTVVSVQPIGDDREVKIGCHTILLSEAVNLLSGLSV
jgi:hypothetical protein